MSLFQKLVATRRFWHSRIDKEATAKPREAAVRHRSQHLLILNVPGNNYDCLAPYTQTFTPASTSQNYMLTNSGKVRIQHPKSFTHAVLPFFDGICMCNPFPPIGSKTAGWKAASSIIPIRPPAGSSRQPILPSFLPCHLLALRQKLVKLVQCVGSILF